MKKIEPDAPRTLSVKTSKMPHVGTNMPAQEDIPIQDSVDDECEHPTKKSDSLAEVQTATEQARQDIGIEASSRKKGTILICIGIVLLVIAGAFFVSNLLFAPKNIYSIESQRYDVPDGLLQEGAVDSATNVVYLYDIDNDATPYAIDYHAVEKGLFGEKDLYESWDGETTFASKTDGNKVAADVQNFRKIVVHLPEEAKGYVAGAPDDAQSEQSSEHESTDAKQVN